MPDDPRVQQLLDELHDSHATPEEVCGSCVELLPAVRTRWQQICRVRAELDAMFPPGDEPGESHPFPQPENMPLPVIPGYEVEALLGLGGMGVVFRARHIRLNRVVALKMALAGAYAGPHERERFQREAEAVAALRHPNVVQIHEVGETDGRQYFTMEYVDGGSLEQKLAGTPLPAAEAAARIAILANAVHVAHKSGIVHRDLKPANILLTIDGDLKISDFGLARRLGGEAGITRTGIAVGTPSYMAPEQARGKADAAGPAADIYSLGAILYETLTGRPPFRAETGAETLHQLLTQEPVPPSRLNGKVPRDLETICLKCLHKESRLRYATAAALADDLGRFLRGEAVSGRPEGRLSRVVRRVRQRPVQSAAVAVAFFSMVALVGGGAWTYSERRAAERAEDADRAANEVAVDSDLQDMAGWLRKSSWPEARAALGRAKVRLGNHEAHDLRRRIVRGERELELAARLESVRLDRAVSTSDMPDWNKSIAAYETEFRAAGLGQLHDDADAVADRIKCMDIAASVTDALDDWAFCVSIEDRPAQTWLLAVAMRTDPDPSDWRAKARAQKKWPTEATTAAFAEAGLRAGRCDPLLLGLGRVIAYNSKDPIPFLTKVQQANPGDLFANLELAEQLVWRNRPDEALRYYQAALANRPAAPALCNKFGLVLGRLGRFGEAVEYFDRAVRFAPESAEFRANLVFGLRTTGRPEEALDHARAGLRFNPRTAREHLAFGDMLVFVGQQAEAAGSYRDAAALDPKLTTAHEKLRATLMRLGHQEDARAAWRVAINLNPTSHQDRYGYAEYCLFIGNEGEYRRDRREMLDHFGKASNPTFAERVGRACLLLPASEDELRAAVALAERAWVVDRAKAAGFYPSYQFVRGLAAYRQGRFDQAVAVMRGEAASVLGPAPRLVLAMALHRNGRATDARKEFATAILGHDWRAARVRDQDDWICHVLRREAEGLILPELSLFMEGRYMPRDNDERLALLGACQFENRSLAVARLYADAFPAAPQLAADYRSGYRFNAACAAALAGCGRSADAASLGDPERAKWRAQAREWLRADLAAWAKALDGNPAGAGRESVRQKLTQWRSDPDLAGLRETAGLDKLPADEQKDCLAFWAEVTTLLTRADVAR